MKKGFMITPWEVSGDIDYSKLIKQFGTEKINDELLKRIKKHTGKLHFMLRRGVFFSHRDLNWLFDQYENGNKFYLYTGRGPSGKMHLGHLLPLVITKWLQDKFKSKLYFQMTDDEKFVVKRNLSLEETNRFAYENALDVIAMGFDPKKTVIFSDVDSAGILYKQALKVAKKLTFSTAKAVFGFTNETNVGLIFYTSMQSVPAFLESVFKKKNIPCLIPHAIDQDPFFRGVAREILPKLGYYKPAAIHCTFLPSLTKDGKMSSSNENSAIFTTDDKEEVKFKVMNAFTGGRDTLKEQEKKGGRPEICIVYKYLYMMFEDNDKKLSKRVEECKKGKIMCKDCKRYLIDKINDFLEDHQRKRKKAEKELDLFFTLKN